MKTSCLCFCFCLLTISTLYSQGFYFGPKGGLAVGTQRWGGLDRQQLFGLHGALFLETLNSTGPGSFFFQLGYHQRGSAENATFFTGGGNIFRQRQKFLFNNTALAFGAKRHLGDHYQYGPFFSFGLRLEYTLSTNLDEYAQFAGYFPIEPFVNKFNYGANISFGYDLELTELIGFTLEATISPDLSSQYLQPAIGSIVSPITGQAIQLREQEIRNLSFEITAGFRFLRKVIYLEDY